MKTNKFILWQIKKWLALFIVTTLIVVVFLRSDAVLADTTTLSAFNLAAFVLPCFVFAERFDKGAADAYRAFPAEKLKIKRIKILIMLVFLVALVTVAYLSGVIFYFMNYGDEYAAQVYSYYNYDPSGLIRVGASSFFMNYFLILVYTVTTYLFNCTLASLGNFVLTSIIYMSAGSLLLTGTIPALILTFASNNGIKDYLLNCLSNGDFMGVGGTYGKQFAISVILKDMYSLEAFSYYRLSTASIVLMVILFVIEVGVGVLSFFISDPSGEHYSMAGARDEKHKLIVYASYAVTFMIIAFLSAVMGNVSFIYFSFYVVTLFIFTVIGTYISFVIFNKRFALKKKELIVLASIVGFGLLITIISYFRISAIAEGGGGFYGYF